MYRSALVCSIALTCSLAHAEDFKLNDQGYFERPGINVMVGQDYYPEGHQGGLSIIMHDERVGSNGALRAKKSMPRGGRTATWRQQFFLRITAKFKGLCPR